MLLVGLTGSIGTGKSTTAAMFKEHDFGVYNADDAVHYIYENDLNVIDKIEELFPGTKENNKVNRKLLRNILNEQPEKFKKLESVVHPVTRRYQITYIEKFCFLEMKYFNYSPMYNVSLKSNKEIKIPSKRFVYSKWIERYKHLFEKNKKIQNRYFSKRINFLKTKKYRINYKEFFINKSLYLLHKNFLNKMD